MDTRGKYVPLDKDDSDRAASPEGRYSGSDSTQVETIAELSSRSAPWVFSSPLPRRAILWLAVVDFILLATAFVFFSYSWLGIQPMTDHELILATNSYSPLLSRTKIEMHEERLKTALINKNNVGGPSIYRQPPSPEVDEAWRQLHKGDRLFLISEEEVLKMGKDPEVVIKAPLDWGYGENQYLAVNQGQHDIHCLNNMRMWVYAEHYYVQTFQCKYSTDVFTAFWVQGSGPPVVDFDVTRKCQKYDNILHWNPEKPYTEEQFLAVRPPPGQKRIPFDLY